MHKIVLRFFLLISVSLSSFCIALTDEERYWIPVCWYDKHYRGLPELEAATSWWQEGRPAEAVEICTSHIEDPTLDPQIRFHFLVARSVFCIAYGDEESHEHDKSDIIRLVKEDMSLLFIYYTYYRKLYYF